MIAEVRESLFRAKKLLGRPVVVLVIGALGRCGRGAVDVLEAAGKG